VPGSWPREPRPRPCTEQGAREMQQALFSTPLSREMLQAIRSSSCFQTCSFQPMLSFPQRVRSIFMPALGSPTYRELSSKLDQAPRSYPQEQTPPCRLHLLTQLTNGRLLAEPRLPAEHANSLPLLQARELSGQVAGAGAAAPPAPRLAGDPQPRL